MSYEGYQKYRCKLGHETSYDAYDAPDKETWRCPGEPECKRCGMPAKECGAPIDEYETVELTNGYDSWGWSKYFHRDPKNNPQPSTE